MKKNRLSFAFKMALALFVASLMLCMAYDFLERKCSEKKNFFMIFCEKISFSLHLLTSNSYTKQCN